MLQVGVRVVFTGLQRELGTQGQSAAEEDNAEGSRSTSQASGGEADIALVERMRLCCFTALQRTTLKTPIGQARPGSYAVLWYSNPNPVVKALCKCN